MNYATKKNSKLWDNGLNKLAKFSIETVKSIKLRRIIYESKRSTESPRYF